MSEKIITVNRKAYHDYHIEDTVEAGLVLTGTEIKSIRGGRVNLKDSYASPKDGELWLVNSHIAQYPGGNRYNHEPTRPRKLLLHQREISEFSSEIERRGYTVVPLKLYLKKGIAKVELGLARGKKQYDKREAIALRDDQRQMQRAFKQGPKAKKR